MLELSVREAIASRRSVRGFLPTPVPRQTVEAILELAARAPSGSNIQPWQVYVCMGEARKKLSEAVVAAYQSEEPHEEEYRYYPRTWREPYLARRRKIGKDLYSLLDIPRGDAEGMRRHFGRNYDFFGAPVGIFFTMDRDMEIGSWLDLGMFIQNVMLAARSFGLETCPQQAHAQFHRVICPLLGIPDTQMLICGMALGYENPEEPANRLVTERAPLSEFVRFVE